MDRGRNAIRNDSIRRGLRGLISRKLRSHIQCIFVYFGFQSLGCISWSSRRGFHVLLRSWAYTYTLRRISNRHGFTGSNPRINSLLLLKPKPVEEHDQIEWKTLEILPAEFFLAINQDAT